MPFRWEPNVTAGGRYRDTDTGRLVAPSVVRDELDNYLANSAEPIDALSEQLRTGQINVADWKTAMKTEIKSAHLNAAAESIGGYQNMTQEHFGRAGAYIKQQYGFLNDFAEQIADGTQKLDGTLTRRMQLYIDKGRESYYRSIQANLGGGVTHIGSILNPADHCIECVGFDGKWFEIGDTSYKAPGRRICNANCKCSERYGTISEDGTILMVGLA